MIFHYLPIGGKPKPALDLILVHGRNRAAARAIIDSGADFCVFDQQLATLLDLPLDKSAAITASGIGGRVSAYPGPVDAQLGGDLLHLHAYFVTDLPINLLGRDNFFHFYIIEFDELSQTFELKPRSAPAPSA